MGKRRYRKRQWLAPVLSLAVLACAGVLTVRGARGAEAVSEREGLEAARKAIVQAAVSSYALNGAYPATYEELKEQSGIAVDEGRYVVFYEIFASNILPDVTVLVREEEP